MIQKIIYRLIISILIFIISAGYFIGSMKETSYTDEIELTEMSGASFPTVFMLRGNTRINLLHGHSQEIESLVTGEEITPLENSKNVDFLINPYGNVIVRAEYEVKDKADNLVVSSGETEQFKREDDGSLSASVKLESELVFDTEYMFKLRLVDEDGRKFIFFTTLKFTRNDMFAENYSFVKRFSEASISKKDEKAIAPYIETDGSMDNSSFSYSNIHSSYNVITWKNLKIERLTEPLVAVTENTSNVSSFVCKYIAATTGESRNYYNVREYYRVNRLEKTSYLLAFERKVEEIYNPEKTSVSRSQLKLGITSKTDNSFVLNKAGGQIAFVRERELWYYKSAENKLKRIFSFRGEDFSDERSYFDNHNVKILRMEEGGDFYFIVYGYMNRGVYEGKTGIALYRYFSTEDRIEEQAYIPVDIPAKLFEGTITEFSYVSSENFFYFSLDDNLYSYSLVKRKLEVIAEDISKDSYITLAENNHIVWQEKSYVPESEKLIIMDLETRQKTEIKAESGSAVAILGKAGGNIIYGIADKKDMIYGKDGNVKILYKSIIVSDVFGEALKTYKKKNVYTTGVEVVNGTIELERVRKKDGVISRIKNDQILNNATASREEVMVVERRTDKYLTEYYLTLPYGLKLEELPEISLSVPNTVIKRDISVKMERSEENRADRYFAVVYGEFAASSSKAADMIELADEGMGYVLDYSGKVIWSRGRTKLSARADDVDTDYIYEEDDSLHSAVRLFLTSQGVYISTEELMKDNADMVEILKSQTEVKSISLSGVSLENVLYYISLGSPVIALKDENIAVLITGYSPQNIEITDVKSGAKSLLGREDAKKIFEAAGNVFISAIN